MAWDHAAIMGFVPYEMPDMFGETEHKIGIAVMPKDKDGKPVGALAEMVAPYAGINPQAGRLIFAAPLMYQTLAATASLSRNLINEIDTLVRAGHVKEETMRDLVKLYETIETETLTAMQIATEGLSVVAAGLKGARKS